MTAFPNSHQHIRRLIQLELDGLLKARDTERLSAHLQECAGCRKFAADLQRLDQTLRLDAAMQREAAARLPGSALQYLPIRKRAKMNPRFVKSFANTLVSLALLAALAAGLIWLLGMQTRQAAPVVLPATPTPLPAVESREQIIAVLEQLAERDASAYTGNAWAQTVTQSQEVEGALSGVYIETWTHIFDGECREALVISSDGPEHAQLYNLHLGLSDGTAGDLGALRRGEQDSLSRDWRCSMTAVDTDAGMLAARLKPGAAQLLIKGPNTLEDVRAWYDNADTQPTLTIEAVFSAEAGPPEVQRETRRFDTATGRMLEETIEMEWADGSPFGKLASVKSTRFLDELPSDISVLFTQLKAELRAILAAADAGAGADPAPTPTPLPASDIAELDALPNYAQSAPLTEIETVETTLRALYQRHLEWIAQPGWITFRPIDADTLKWDLTYSVLLHSLPDGRCEMLTYYVKDGVRLPQEIRLADGQWGVIGSVQEGVFTEGEGDGQPCRGEDLMSVQTLSGLIDTAAEIRSGDLSAGMQAWVETRIGRSVLVIYQDWVYQGILPSTMDPETRRLEPQTRSEEWTFFDLETGAYAGTAYQAYLQNGKVFGEPYQPGGPLPEEAVRLDPLPADLEETFNQALAGMKAYLAARP